MTTMSNYPSLIDFWRIRRKMAGQHCEVMPFHEEIADKLTKLVCGTLGKPNLMILMPPRCAKTDLANQTFISWALSWFPDSEFICSSYGADLAVDNAVNVRETLSSGWYQSMVDSSWGARMDMRGSKAAGRQDHFFTQQGGVVKAVGRGGAATGFGAGQLREEFGGVVLIDDPLKALEARSAAARKEAWAHISGTLKSRRNRQDDPITPTVLIMQRLHPEDPAGMFMREERDEWDILQIPAHDDQNNVIWPGRLSMKQLELIKETDPETYDAQYMQEPSSSKRAIFKDHYWRYWRDQASVESQITLKFITSDTAFEAKTSADWSVLQCWGAVSTSCLVLIDQIRGKWDYPDLTKASKQFWEKHTAKRSGVTPVTEFWIENKASGISLVQTMRSVDIPARPWDPKDLTPKDKVGRAKHSTMPLSTGRVWLPDPKMVGFEWVNRFIAEHSAFTDDDSHLNDDQVDGHTEASSIWQERGGGTGPIRSLI
jgi:predicted phage terminase large subunit-like protein